MRFNVTGSLLALSACFSIGCTGPEVVENPSIERANYPGREAIESLRDLGVKVTLDADERAFSLDLNGVSFSRVQPYLEELPGIKELDISGSRVNYSAFKTLEGNVEIEFLDLSETWIGDDCLRIVGTMKSLRVLRLDATSITDVGIRELRNLSRLETLSLWATQVTDESWGVFGSMTTLQSLDLSDTRVSSAGMENLCGTSLIELDLSESNVDDKGIRLLACLENLSVLRLEDCPITNEAVDDILELRHLTYLAIDGSHIEPQKVKLINKRLPFCEVSFRRLHHSP